MTAPYYDRREDRFWIPTDDGPLWFDSALEAQDAQRQLEVDAAVKAERDRIVAWLRNEETEYPASQYSGFAAMIAEEIEALEHLK